MADIRVIINGVEVLRQDVGNGNNNASNTASGFAEALQDAIDNGTMLWWDQDVELREPVVVTIRKATIGLIGLRMNGRTIRSKIDNGDDVLSFYIDGNIECRHLRVQDAMICGNGSEGCGLTVSCSRGSSAIDLELRGVAVEDCGDVGVKLQGSIEGCTFDLCTRNNKGYGVLIDGDPEATGISMFGGSHRNNGRAPLNDTTHSVMQYGVVNK